MNNRLIKSNDAGGGGACTNTVDLYNPFPDGGGVALYQLNGDATDVSPNANNGTLIGTGTYGAGVFGQAYVNNNTSAISCGSFGVSGSSATFSASMWVKFDTLSFAQVFAMITGSNTTNSTYALAVNTSGNIYIDAYNVAYFFNNTAVVANQWYHIVGVSNASNHKLYINGSLAGEINQSLNFVDNFRAIGGRSIDNSTIYPDALRGSIDQVRIFSRALRPYEVEALYTEEYCTPTIVPSEHFNTVLYDNNNRVPQSITGVGFQPDFVWIKDRGTLSGNIENHVLFDSVRGAGKHIYSNLTNAEVNNPTSLTSFDSDGFSVGTDEFGFVNYTGRGPYVAWNFKAGGAAVTNTDGTITSQVSANTEAGFSIVSYTGNGANGTVGHGLGVTPNIVLTKRRNSTSNWSFNGNIGGLIYGTNKLALNDTAGISADTNEVLAANSNNFTAGTSGAVGASGGTYVAYCFAEVEGFSNFGSYVGTGASGNTVVTGFEPAFVMLKRTSSTGNWVMYDNKRDLENPRTRVLYADDPYQELPTPDVSLNILENGFEINGTSTGVNASGGSYIYMAFAADPTAVEPTLEDSFNTVTYTGNGGTQSITSLGFQPDFVWIKNRTEANNHVIFDSVRGDSNSNGYYDRISPNLTTAEQADITDAVQTLDANGFTVHSAGDGSQVNDINDNYVAWNWKGAEIPAINSNGSIPSVVSANPAAGFSIVSYTGTGSPENVGHGLGVAPSIYIIKNRDTAIDWTVLTNIIDGSMDYLFLNQTAAAGGAGETQPTATTFNELGNTYVGALNNNYIAYCFAEVAGFSKFGSYVGNGSTNGPTITTGFEPAFVMIKRTDNAANWVMKDIKRGNLASLYPNLSDAEYTIFDEVDFLVDGFQLKSSDISSNSNSSTYIYMAFANQF